MVLLRHFRSPRMSLVLRPRHLVTFNNDKKMYAAAVHNDNGKDSGVCTVIKIMPLFPLVPFRCSDRHFHISWHFMKYLKISIFILYNYYSCLISQQRCNENGAYQNKLLHLLLCIPIQLCNYL